MCSCTATAVENNLEKNAGCLTFVHHDYNEHYKTHQETSPARKVSVFCHETITQAFPNRKASLF
jgi:hypothetical protein